MAEKTASLQQERGTEEERQANQRDGKEQVELRGTMNITSHMSWYIQLFCCGTYDQFKIICHKLS